MNRTIVSAIFDSHTQAERAVAELKTSGIDDRGISVLHLDSDRHRNIGDHDHDETDNKGSGAAKGAGIGAGVGALAGLAALAIPGVGPFLAMGAVVETLGIVGSAAVTSAAVGAAAGGIAGALMKYGVSEDEARYYDRRIHEGGIWVGVDTTKASANPMLVQRILRDAGGENAEAARAGAM